MAVATYVRTHVYITFADPYLTCDRCGCWVEKWHNDDRCGCGPEWGAWNEPCGHKAGATTVCPSWGPVDGCTCARVFGQVDHPIPPGGG